MTTINGTSGDDTLLGTSAAETISGGDGNDVITGGAGNDEIYGGKGTDTASFSGTYSNYNITTVYEDKFGVSSLVGYSVAALSGTDGTDLVFDVEYLTFSDGTYRFDGESVVSLNSEPTGIVAITGTSTQGQTLTASNTLADADGLGTITYTWKAGTTTVGTGSTYTLTQAEVGKTMTVTASYIDGYGTAESTTSSATSAVANINDSPTGTVSITGTSTQGQTLTASNTLADADGLGTIIYTWKAGTTTVGTGSTYTLTQAEVGKTMTVTASYTDGLGTAESKISAATSIVTSVNESTTGQSLTGTAANDSFTSGTENDYFDGGAGLDQVVFSANRSAYTVSKSDSGFSVSSSPDGTDTLINIERLEFSDVNLAFDVSASGNAGQARLFLGTIAHALIDNPGVEGTILYFFDQGMSMQQVCQLAVDVNLISALAGSSSNADLARLVWRNVVGVEADNGAVDLLVSFMDGRNAAFSQAQLLTAVSQLDINQQRVDLVGLATTGMEYLPFAG
jgi:GH24 family phage-related lysozyme (muramidase)